MPSYRIPEPEFLAREIALSHDRCRRYGVDPDQAHNTNHTRLSPEELRGRLAREKEFLDVAVSQIQELYRSLAGTGIVVSFADKEGYMLDIFGDPALLERMATSNYRPGYRWTEKDVGTSALSLSLERGIPVQINEREHYCQRGYDYTCSASPVLNGDDDLFGVLAISGRADDIHPHTLGIAITAARAIENQIKNTRTSRELLIRNNYMNALLDSIDSGVMAVDRSGLITQINDQGRRILRMKDNPLGRPLSDFLGAGVDWKILMHAGFGYVDQELFIRGPRRPIQLIHTARPIFESEGKVQGILFVFHEINRIRKLVNEMAGSQARFTFEDIIGVDQSIQEAKKLAMLAAASKSTALLLGETGTGKELFAQAIHNTSERRHHPFVAINCCAIPRELLESELFGYADGAFTGARKGGRPGKFELANGGTLFLDEIGDMPTDMQNKLLRVLQTGEVSRIGEHKPISVDIRIVAATHCDLKQEVRNGNFREDLFYRLNVFPINLPPLRQRGEDILILARHILNRCAQILQKPGVGMAPEAEKTLLSHQWPGNVRELENVIERAVNLVEDNVVKPNLFNLMIPDNRSKSGVFRASRLEEVERQVIAETIEDHEFNLVRAAKTLGISRATLYKKLKKYGIVVKRKNV